MTVRSKTLVLAPWGEPRGWVQAKYIIDGVEAYSFTSLYPVVQKHENARVVVLVADTIAKDGAEGYRGVVESARRYAESFLCGLEAIVEVLPGAIATPRAVFEGSLTDYYYKTLRVVLGHIHDTGASEVAVDLTHGVNYMPSLTLKAAEEAAALASFTQALAGGGTGVRLVVYNSDPLQPSNEQREHLARSEGDPCKPKTLGQGVEPPVLKVNRVLKRVQTVLDLLSNIEPLLRLSRDEMKPITPSTKECRLDGRVEVELVNAVGEAMRLLKMLRYGLIPQLVWFIAVNKGLPERLEKALEEVEKLWEEGIQVGSDGRLVVRRCRRLGEGYRVLLYAYHIARALRTLFREGDPERGISLGAVGRLQDALKTSKVIWTIQAREREKIVGRLGDIAPGKWVSLRELYGLEEGECRVNMFVRDLIAHGGWHTDVVEVRAEEPALEKAYYRLRKDFNCEGKELWEIISSHL
jgi:CRISPR-associated protein Csx1